MGGWKIKRLGDVCEKVDYGHTASAKEAGDGPKFLRITDIQNGSVAWHSVPVCECEPNELKKYILQRGDMVFARTGATTGKSYLVADCPNNAIFASYLIRVRPKTQVSPPYLAYFFQTQDYWEQVSTSSSGSAQPGVNATKLKNLQVPLPPFPEQERIVAILDEAFAAIATATANAEKNLANARELFESELNRVFSQKGDGWVETTLGACLSVQPRNGWSPPAAHHSDSGVPVLTLSSVTGFQFKGDKVKFTSAPSDPERHYWVKDGDFLITRSNTPELVGHVAIAHGITKPTIYPDLIMRMNPDESRLLTEFLYYQMRTLRLRDEIMGRAQGANPTMKKINKGSVQTLPISLPTFEIQQVIVEELDELSQETKNLEEVQQRKLTLLTQLKQSILQKAFSGELTADAKAADRTLSEAGV